VPDLPILFLIIFAIHLAPAFTPPTFPVIILYILQGRAPLWLVVIVAAAGAASGRLVLAMLFRTFGHRLPARLRGNLTAAHAAIDQRKHRRWIIPGLFLLGSSSAPLFEAAGLTGLRMAPLTAIYFIGRLPRYWLYAVGAKQFARTDFWADFRETLTSPGAIALELAMIVLIVLLIRTDWSRWLKR
jgi:membrane protein YqaA with SNARE-associated domain